LPKPGSTPKLGLARTSAALLLLGCLGQPAIAAESHFDPAKAVILQARYEGQIASTQAEFKAEFQVHCFEARTKLLIPLGRVRLREGALLDGAQTYLDAVTEPQPGFTLAINGRENSQHTVQLRFSLSLTASGAEQELAFDIPAVVQSQLTLNLPAG